MKHKIKTMFAAAAIAATLAGCATSGGGYYGGQPQPYPPQNQPYPPQGQSYPPQQQPAPQQQGMSKTSKGAIIGALAGVAAGLLSGDDATERRQRALVGAGIGGLAGGAIGNYQDRQERALREQMAGTGVDVVRQGDNITLNMPSGITFDFDKSNLKPEFYPVLDNVARTLQEYNQTIVEVAGHTDSVGSDAYNQRLSEQRANAVSSYLTGRGLNRDRFIVVGAGESRPVASNDTDAGRAENRRVEITLVPIQS
ncbi:outer membrane protein OmpA-like peptidoglycan-associated protein [Lysobacter niastensis]|jgi:outer membrane protein OmpA-like peptidoglycan-associated protein|uniref:Outer membrane protein OmpA-like peptidoglycan-associated protein n=1 Tax=Lysobacter niastensis TaxID=380629 RepID=A0ABU1WA88_9GAMM|nr:OmpA family protein [Lysobacter niastensis]MDR7134549.1 outer membrane protein OmpA-like peptidoglycan-associated protein [Lysobacter niastensis]